MSNKSIVNINEEKFWGKYGYWLVLLLAERSEQTWDDFELKLFMCYEDSGDDYCWNEISYGMANHFPKKEVFMETPRSND